LSGHISGLSGDAGVAPVRFDSLGRLLGMRPADSSGWSMAYDPRGRPAAVTAPDGTVDAWVWHPDAAPEDGAAGLLATGVESSVPWVFLDGGMAARRNSMDLEGVVTDGSGDPSWLLDGTGGATTLVHSPMGMPGQSAAGVLGSKGRLQWFAGGPLQVGALSLDPVSGQRTDGDAGWPWAVGVTAASSLVHAADPGPWAPVGMWSNPLAVLQTMGELGPIADGEWRAISQTDRGFVGLPESVDGAPPPMGPGREMLPLGDEDPLSEWLIHCLLPGGEAPDTESIVGALLSREIELPWLPPDFPIPGLERWRS
jgi:YD repeat-containing protein